MSKSKILFICVHNSARSRIVEGIVNARCGEFFEAQSAGLECGHGVNPLAAAVMEEIGIDIASKPRQEVFDVYKSGQLFAYVITVCHESDTEDARSSLVQRSGSIGRLPILPPSLAHGKGSSIRRARCGMRLRPGSRNGARKCARRA